MSRYSELFAPYGKMTHQWSRNSFEQLREFIYNLQEPMFEDGLKLRAAVDTPEKLAAYRKEARQVFIDSIGGLLPRGREGLLTGTATPIDPQEGPAIDRGSYTVRSICFQSAPGVYVTGSYYVPKNIKTPSPAVLFVCGHGNEGRLDDDYQKVCQTIVAAGFIVFAMDPLGQGERANFYDPETKEFIIKRTTPDHDAVGIPGVATGSFLARYFLRDEMAGVDWMLTRPEIDPTRLGLTGNSGGGTQTVAMMIVDDRIQAAAPGTFVTNRRRYMYSGQCQDAEQIWPGVTAKGFDHASAFFIFAPKPAAILAVDCDFFPIEGTEETFAEAKRVYEMLGRGNNVRLYVDHYTHCYTPKLARDAAAFFSEIFFGKAVAVDNSAFTDYPVEEMRFTKSGQVTVDFADALTVTEERARLAAELKKNRLAKSREAYIADAAAFLGEKAEHGRIKRSFNSRIFTKNACVQYDGYMGTSVSWWSQEKLFNYGVMIKPYAEEDIENKPTVIALWEDGTLAIEEHADWIGDQIEQGKQVFVLDLTGMGHIVQRATGITGDPELDGYYIHHEDRRQYGTMYCMATNLIYAGDSLPAMHIYEATTAVEMLHRDFGVAYEDMTFYCDGQVGSIGVMTAFLLRHGRGLNIAFAAGEKLMTSVEADIIGQKVFNYDNTYTVLLPGMLKYFDIDELVRLM